MSAVSFDRDQLAIMNENDLQHKLNHFRNAIEADRRRGRDTFELEVEFCYLWTEAEKREQRREAHAQYVLDNPHLFEDYSEDYGDDSTYSVEY